MEITESRDILERGDGMLCVVNPMSSQDCSGRTCVIKNINGSWVTIRCSEGDFNIRAKDISTLNMARIKGWR